MKKQLLLLTLTLGFVATTNCHKQKSYSLSSGNSVTVSSKHMPKVPAEVTVTRAAGKHNKNRWVLTNNGATAVTVRVKRK